MVGMQPIIFFGMKNIYFSTDVCTMSRDALSLLSECLWCHSFHSEKELAKR